MQFTPVTQDPSLPHAIVCDIDGTLANMTGRSPYDYSRVSEDTVDTVVLNLLSLLLRSGKRILFVSGRDGECYDETKKWIESYYSGEYQLVMRATGDKRCDSIVKREILDELIKEYYIEFTLDDRDRVVKMWRESGIKCLQVAEGNF